MTPQYQRYLNSLDKGIRADRRGDCFAACLASILDADLRKGFPNYHHKTKWWDRWCEFVAVNYGRHLESVVLCEFEPEKHDYWIACQPAQNIYHSTIWKGQEFFFDPWPGGAPVTDYSKLVDTAIFLI